MILCEGDVLRCAIDIRAAEAVVSVIFSHGLTMDRVDPQPAVACCLIRERTGDGRKRAQAAGVKFGRKPKLSDFQRKEALKRRAAGETLAEIAKSYAVDISMISRLS
jgi:hypothetical protein